MKNIVGIILFLAAIGVMVLFPQIIVVVGLAAMVLGFAIGIIQTLKRG